MRKAVFIVLLCLTAAFSAESFAPGPALSAETNSFIDIQNHWAEATVKWGAGLGIVEGFPNGTFRPNGEVTEAQFLAMLYRAYPDAGVRESGQGAWYKPYYAKAEGMNWPVALNDAGGKATRGQLARIIAASQGKLLGTDAAVNYVLKQGLAQGRGAAGFAEKDKVTRAEAVQFVRNVVKAGLSLHSAKAAQSDAGAPTAATSSLAVSGISLGGTEAELLHALGVPARKDASEYGFTWYVYNKDFRKFAMFGISDGKIVAVYANGSNWSMKGLSGSNAESDALHVLGKPISYILKGNTRMMLDDGEERDTFQSGETYTTVFYDVHENNKLSAVFAIDAGTEKTLRGFYASNPTSALRESFEHESLDLANTARVKRGLQPLAWNDKIATTAHKHSADMAENNYFSHTDLQGKDPFDRMEADGISYRAAGENIAAGQASAIFAHEAWMNSEGHRSNILGNYTRLGVGVAFGSDGQPYYTQNFFTPLQ